MRLNVASGPRGKQEPRKGGPGLTDLPELLVVAGPNGAGKTTLAREYESTKHILYVGADAIAESIAPSNPEGARFEAGRQFLQVVHDCLSRAEPMVVETTLSGRSFRRTIFKAKEMGYSVAIAYLFLESEAACIARVSERVRKGGHRVPDDDVRRRFSRSLVNFWNTYRKMADTWILLYNGMGQLQDVAVGSGEHISIRDTTLFADYMRIIGEIQDD